MVVLRAKDPVAEVRQSRPKPSGFGYKHFLLATLKNSPLALGWPLIRIYWNILSDWVS